MSVMLVCPSGHAAAVASERAPSHVLGFGSPGDPVPAVAADHVLRLAFHDIDRPREGLVMPAREDVAALVDFGRGWPGARPLLVHCRMGISRSTAAAFVLACLREPDRPERGIAASLRAASPCATPNARIVSLADDLLGREGRMREAVRLIGRGADYAPYRFFALDAPRSGAPEASPE